MLVLSVKPGKSIMIGENIRVIVSKSRGPVRLGVEAPSDLRILREGVAVDCVTNKTEALNWFCAHSGGSVKCVREDGVEMDATTYLEADAFFGAGEK